MLEKSLMRTSMNATFLHVSLWNIKLGYILIIYKLQLANSGFLSFSLNWHFKCKRCRISVFLNHLINPKVVLLLWGAHHKWISFTDIFHIFFISFFHLSFFYMEGFTDKTFTGGSLYWISIDSSLLIIKIRNQSAARLFFALQSVWDYPAIQLLNQRHTRGTKYNLFSSLLPC